MEKKMKSKIIKENSTNDEKLIKNKFKNKSSQNKLNTTNSNYSSKIKSNTKLDLAKKLPRTYLYFIYFLIFAFTGWLLETAFSFYSLGHFTKRGFLYGPLCPIYGFGAIILIMFFSTYKNKNMKLFIYASIVFTIFEYFVGFILDALFQIRLWDYTGEFLNLNGRVSIFYSFAWGIIAILFINSIYPFFKKKINLLLSKIPYKLQITLVYILFIVFIADTVCSSIKYILL